jgi:hypothetical protein
MLNEKDTKPCLIINLQDYCANAIFDNRVGQKAGEYLQRQHRTQVRVEISKYEELKLKEVTNGQ